jgi:hypothetical protein
MKHFAGYIILLGFLCSFKGNTDGWIKIDEKETLSALKEGMNWYGKQKNYMVSIKYESFEDYVTPIPSDKSEGYYKQEGKNYHSFALGIHTIQNERMKLIVDSARKTIVLSDKDTAARMSPYSSDEILKLLSGTKGMLKQGLKDGMQYRIDCGKNSSFERYEFIVGKDKMLNKLCYYLREAISHDVNNPKAIKTMPRAEINFYNPVSKPVLDYKKEFDESRYVMKKDKGYVPVELFKNYRVKDLRIIKQEKKK